VLDVGAIAAGHQQHRLAVCGVHSQLLALGLRRTGLRQQIDGAVEADRQDIVVPLQRDVGIAHPQVGPKAAETGADQLAALRVLSQISRQRQQCQRLVEIERFRINAARQRDALRLGCRRRLRLLRLGLALCLARRRRRIGLLGGNRGRLGGAVALVGRFRRSAVSRVTGRGGSLAELDVRTVGSLAQADRQAGRRVVAQQPCAVAARGRRLVGARRNQRPGIAAGGIVGTADEGTELAELQAEAAVGAGRTGARIAAALAVAEEVRAEQVVEGIQHLLDPQVLDAVNGIGEVAPEVAQHRLPVDAPAGDVVELLLQRSGEAVGDVAVEEALQKCRDQPAAVLRDEALALQADVLAVLQHRDDAGVGGRPADAELLQALDQARLGEAGRRLGEVLLRGDAEPVQRLAAGDVGQHPVAVVATRTGPAALRLRIIPALAVDPQKAVEGDDRAGGAEHHLRVFRGDIHRHLVEYGGFHLARQRPLPDQRVEAALVAVQVGGDVGRLARKIGGPDRLVRFLGVLRLGLVQARLVGDIAAAELGVDHPPAGGDRLGRHLHAIGSHVGDEADRLAADADALVEPLRHAHGVAGAESQLARRLLLQRRGDERRRRIAADLLALDGGDGIAPRLGRSHGAQRRRLVREVELLQLAAVEVGQRRRQRLAALLGEDALDRPVLARAEVLNLRLALADQP